MKVMFAYYILMMFPAAILTSGWMRITLLGVIGIGLVATVFLLNRRAARQARIEAAMEIHQRISRDE